MVQFTVIFANILFLSVLDLYTITQPDYIIISFQQKHATQYVDSCAAYINDYATSFITCHLPNNCACYYTTNNTECIAMNSSEFRNDAKNKHSRSPSVKLARDRNSHRMEDALNTKMKDCIAYYGTHVASSPRAPLARSQSRMLLPIRHANQMVLGLTTDRYRCVDNADCYGTQHDQYMTRMEASNNRSLTRPFGHFKSRVNSTSQVSFHTPIPQSVPFDHVGIYPSYTPSYGTVSASLLAFFAINHVHCITHMPSVFLWFVLLSHQMIVPAQAQTMNGSSFSCTGYQECLDIQCNDDQDCFVACAGDYACNTANIHAPSNANLFVECSSTRSCYTATIYGPSIGNLTVNCTIGRYTCYDVTIHGPTNGTLTVICEGAGDNGRLCEGIDIYCPIYGGCDVQCLEGDEYDCLRLLLDARSMINGALSLYSASGINKGTVWCPPNSGNDNECIISCETARACEDATVNTEPDSRLFITGKGSDTLKSTTIYCPSGNGICSINVSGDNYNMLSDLTIYAVNGLKNVSLSCNASNASYCYSVLNPISMGCTSDYGVRFHIALEPGSTDDWYGVDVNVTALCDDNTPISSGHYGSVFWCNSYHECSNIFCNDDQDCFISCGFLYTGDWGCETANIKAPSNANLVVECVSSYACSTASIYGPSIGNLIVNCIPFDNGGVDACKDLTVYGPTNGNLTVICEGRGGIYNWHVCDGIYIYCPVYGECDVQCPDGHQNDCIQLVLDARNTIDGTLSLHSVPGIAASTVWCPGNDNECIISCESSGSGGCQSATIYTKPDTKLFITAVGTNALKSMTVYCPSGKGTCSIKASGDNYDMLSDLGIYSVNGLNDVALSCNASDSSYCYSVLDPVTIACSSDYGVRGYIALQSGSIDDWHGADANLTSLCNDDTTNGYYGSSFLCREHSECSKVFCNDDQDCSVICEIYMSCRYAQIYAPSNANLVVECSGCGSCQRADIYGAFIGNLIVNCTPCPGTGDECYLSNIHGPTNGNLTVSLDGSGFERYIDIDCPLHGRCDVQCLARDCSQLVLDARGMINGSLSLHSVSSISESTVWCPGNDNECIISCESGGCQSATINTEADSKLFVTAEGTNTLQNTSIYCPTGKSAYINGECSITVASDTYGALSNTYIYAVNGFNNLSLTCNYSSNVTNCYDESLRPRLFCLPDFSASCDLTLQSAFDVWECQNGSHALMCDWSHSPTFAPTPVTPSPSTVPTTPPSVLTSAPTTPPSRHPTTAPSSAPSTAPSAVTSAPTTSPSNAPFHCSDYEESSNNGTNETSFRYQTVNESQYTVSMDENSQYFITNQSNSYVMETIQCNEISDCWVECNV
eukprot:129078_1